MPVTAEIVALAEPLAVIAWIKPVPDTGDALADALADALGFWIAPVPDTADGLAVPFMTVPALAEYDPSDPVPAT